MKCQKCNSENKDTSKYCYSCGIELKQPQEVTKKSGKRSNDFQQMTKMFDRNKKIILINLLSFVALIVIAVMLFRIFSADESGNQVERYEILSSKLVEQMHDREVPAKLGEQYADYDIFELLGIDLHTSFNNPQAVSNANIRSVDILECKVSGETVEGPEIVRAITETYDQYGRMVTKHVNFTSNELHYPDDEKFFEIKFVYNSVGQLSEKVSPSVNGGDGYSVNYTFNTGRLTRYKLSSYDWSRGYEMMYNQNGVLKWIFGFNERIGMNTEKDTEGTELLYDDKSRVKRIFSVTNNLKPVDGYGYDIQYAEQGTMVKYGETKNKKVISGTAIFHSKIVNFDSRGLVTAVRRYENSELKEIFIYKY